MYIHSVLSFVVFIIITKMIGLCIFFRKGVRAKKPDSAHTISLLSFFFAIQVKNVLHTYIVWYIAQKYFP